MTDIDLEELDGKIHDERARTVTTLRELAIRLERLPRDKLCDALPTVNAHGGAATHGLE